MILTSYFQTVRPTAYYIRSLTFEFDLNAAIVNMVATPAQYKARRPSAKLPIKSTTKQVSMRRNKETARYTQGFSRTAKQRNLGKQYVSI